MRLEESVDCDGTCSTLDPIGCEIIPHQEVEKQLDKSLKSLPSETYYKYVGFMHSLQRNYPTTYKILKCFGF